MTMASRSSIGLRRHLGSRMSSPKFLLGFCRLLLFIGLFPLQFAAGMDFNHGQSLYVPAEAEPHHPLWHGHLQGLRIGEALHPGPTEFLTVGTSNPGGLPNKELLAVGQGSGIWSYSETHLSAVTQASAAKAFKYHASQEGRHLRVHFGAPVALRSRSTWAGTWSGTACTSDFSSKRLQVDWPAEFLECRSGAGYSTVHWPAHYQGDQFVWAPTRAYLAKGTCPHQQHP